MSSTSPGGWQQALPALIDSGAACVLVSVADVRGSTPREPGTSMLVTPHTSIGTIGGGQLELQATQLATGLIRESQPATVVRRYPLGPELGQCCGGVATLLFEYFAPPTQAWMAALGAEHGVRAALLDDTAGPGEASPVVAWSGTTQHGTLGSKEHDELARAQASALVDTGQLVTIDAADGPRKRLFVQRLAPEKLALTVFGAGHVGKALVAVASVLPWSVRWVDSRAHEFPAAVPAGVECLRLDNPLDAVHSAPPGSAFVVMTHSHALDLELVTHILQRDDSTYCGLIGSNTKRRRFTQRLDALGLAEASAARLTCPIGATGTPGALGVKRSKHPASIAIATVAEILATVEAHGASVA